MVYSNLEVVAYEPSPIGAICLRRRELPAEPGTLATEITLDGDFLMSSVNTASEQALASIGLEWHGGRDLDVLVGGLGLGYTAQAALAGPTARVEVVEFLPPVIDWLERGLFPLADELRADSRFSVRAGDIFDLLAPKQDSGLHDLVIIDVDHSPDECLNAGGRAFYSEEGLLAAKSHLAADGVLGIWSYTESPVLVETLGRVFDEVRVESIDFDNRAIDEPETNWLFFAR